MAGWAICYKGAMRRLALLAIVLAGSAAAAAWAGPANKVLELAICGSATQYTFLFWPHGHPAIASVDFPTFPPPHLEAYSGTNKKYPNSAFVASAAANGAGGTKPGCRPFVPKVSIVFHAKSVTMNSTALVCTFHSAPVHEFVRLSSGGLGYSAIDPPKRQVLYAQLSPTGAKLSYDSSFCRATPSPH